MKVHILGTGTSQGVPVIACGCEVCTSKDAKDNRLRSSIWISSEKASVVVDTGPDFRYQMLRAQAHDLDAVLFTHQHKDHVAGLDDIRPFNYLLNKVIDVYAEAYVQVALRNEFHYIFDENPPFGLPKINLLPMQPGVNIRLGDLDILPIRVMHHRLPIMGFRVGDFAYITDAKSLPDESIAQLQGLKVLLVNALQQEAHHAHFTLEEALAFAEIIKAEQTYFTHISHKMGKYEDINPTLPPHVQLAYDGLVLDF